jgi:predicted outer membrane protein
MTIWPVRDGAVAASIALVAVIVAQAASVPVDRHAPEGNEPARSLDLGFAARASEALATEIQMAKIAVDRGTSGDVREFARRTLIENSKARRDLAQIIAGSGDQTIASLPPSRGDRAAVAKLRAATPENFDRLYVSLRLAAQEAAIRRLTARRAGENRDSSDWRAMLSVVGEQLATVRAMADEGLPPSTQIAGEPHS